jgi:sugar phosphate isomerase/epimerase
MKLSCTDAIVPGDTLTEKAASLRRWGYDGIAVFAEYSSWTDDRLEELLRLEGQTGVKPCEFVFMDPIYGHLMDPDRDKQERAIEMYRDAVRVCKKIGAITEMEFDYGPQDPLPLFEPYKRMSEAEEADFLRVLDTLGAEAEGSSAWILVEPINRYETHYLTRLQDVKVVVDKTKCSNVGILADFFHMSIEESDLPASIRNAGSLIRHVHLADSNRLLPGYGHTDWPACIQALSDVGFTGFLNLECGVLGDTELELPKTARFLRRLIETARE